MSKLIPMGERGVQLHTLEDAFRFASLIKTSGLAPRGMDTPEQILVAIQYGAEIGLGKMQALQAVVVIHGRPFLLGKAALAVIRSSPVCSFLETRIEGEPADKLGDYPDDYAGVVISARVNDKNQVFRYAVRDAKRAGLWGKSGPWSQSPDDMLIWRAVSRCANRYYSDVLLGVELAEVGRDYNAPVVREAKPVEDELPADDALLSGLLADGS